MTDLDNDLILALNTLATFKHSDLSEDFQKNIIVQFLDNDNVAIRAQVSIPFTILRVVFFQSIWIITIRLIYSLLASSSRWF